MLSTPTPIIDPASGKLNPVVLNAIKACKKPHLVIVYGPPRIGKSSILNQLILGQKDSRLCHRTSPFIAQGGAEGVTRGCNVVGPFTVRDLSDRMLLPRQTKPNEEIFFIDSEGTAALDGNTPNIIAAIFTVLQVATVSILMKRGTPDRNDIQPLFSQIEMSKILSNSCDRIRPGEICIPIIFCNGIEQIHGQQISIEQQIEMYCNQGERLRELVERYVDEDEDTEEGEKMLNTASSLKVVASPPHFDDRTVGVDLYKESIDLYWVMISNLLKEILDAVQSRVSRTGVETVELMEILFQIFLEFQDAINEDIRESLTNIANQQFETQTMESVNKFTSTLLEGVNQGKEESLRECIAFIEDQVAASKTIEGCIDPNLKELYRKLIPKTVQGFVSARVATLQREVQNKLNEKIERVTGSIIAQDNIKRHLQDLAKQESAVVFRDDIPAALYQATTYQTKWNQEVESKRVIFEYFQKTKPESFNTLKSNFINRLTQDSTSIVNSKPQWTSYKDSKISEIRNRAGARLNELKRQIEYLEDKDRIIPSAENLRNELKVFDVANAPLNESRRKEILDRSLAVCQEERNKLSFEGVRKWSDVEAEIVAAANQAMNNHLLRIKNVDYRNDIDRSKTTQAALRAIIPNNLIQSVKPSRTKEAQDTLTNLALERSKSFEGEINSIPLWEDCKKALTDLSNQRATNYINERLRPKYIEDIPVITADNIFTDLAGQGFYQKANIKASKNNEAVSIMREVSNRKLNEFNAAKGRKVSWQSIKNDRIQKVRGSFEAKKNEILGQFYYKDFNAKPNPFGNYQPIVSGIPNLYNDVEQHKRGELENQIRAIASEYERAFNNSANGKPSWNDKAGRCRSIANDVTNRIVSERLNGFTYRDEAGGHRPNADGIYNAIINTPGYQDNSSPKKNDIIGIAREIANQGPGIFDRRAFEEKPQRPSPPPQPPQPTLRVGSRVRVIGPYAKKSTSDSAPNTYAIGWERVIMIIKPGTNYPYCFGDGEGYTGWAKAESLQLI